MASALTSISLVENSLKMRELQKEVLERRIGRRAIDLSWEDKIEDVSDGEYYPRELAERGELLTLSQRTLRWS